MGCVKKELKVRSYWKGKEIIVLVMMVMMVKCSCVSADEGGGGGGDRCGTTRKFTGMSEGEVLRRWCRMLIMRQ